jgi:hypothetical protein
MLLAKKQEDKTRDDVVNLAQDDQACSGYSDELTEPRVISG